MQAIVVYKKYHNMSFEELIPEVFLVKEGNNPSDVLREKWEDNYNGAMSDNLILDGMDPVDEENCWCECSNALITWQDGDVMEFHIVDVK